MIEEKYKTALDLFYKKNYKDAAYIFEGIKAYYECAYCELFCSKLKSAQDLFKKAPDSPASNWGLCLIDLINFNIPSILTYFQIRNFLERDLNLLIENKQLEYAGNIISAADILTEYNPETPKFIGRVLLLNNFKTEAIDFLRQAKDINNNDPETHFLLAQYYLAIKQPSAAVKILQAAVNKNENYLPIKKLLNRIAY